jgi:hypothetical protein
MITSVPKSRISSGDQLCVVHASLGACSAAPRTSVDPLGSLLAAVAIPLCPARYCAISDSLPLVMEHWPLFYVAYLTAARPLTNGASSAHTARH